MNRLKSVRSCFDPVSRFDFIRLRHAEVGHSIEYSTADLDFYFLSVPFSGLELRSDNPFKPRRLVCDRFYVQRPIEPG
jgi:hypothetical protein